VALTGQARQSDDDPAGTPPSDTPAADRLWDGMLAWMRGTFVVYATAIAISTTLGWPRREAGQLSGSQIGFLVSQAVVCSAFVVRSGWRLCRRFAGAAAVALTAGVPGSLALLLVLAWRGSPEPASSWGELLWNSARLAALEAVPVGYLLWQIARRWPGGLDTDDTTEAE
jgi:hypothetical protein